MVGRKVQKQNNDRICNGYITFLTNLGIAVVFLFHCFWSNAL